MEYIREVIKQSYSQNTIIIDTNNNVYKVESCTDLGWFDKKDKGYYFLVAKFLYEKDSSKE